MKIDTKKLTFFKEGNGIELCNADESNYMWIGDIGYFYDYRNIPEIDVTDSGVDGTGFYAWNEDIFGWERITSATLIKAILDVMDNDKVIGKSVTENATDDIKRIYFSGIEELHIKVNDETIKIIENLIACGVIEREMYIYKEPLRIIDLT